MILNFSHAHCLIVGDVMLDSYWQGETRRISPEAPVPVVHVHDQSSRIGGAGNVAMNVASLGAQASLLSVMGDDEAGRELQDLLQQSCISNLSMVDHRIATTKKLRVLSQHQQLIRLDFEQLLHDLDMSPIMRGFEQALDDADIIILSDYGKGMLTNTQPFIRLAKARGIPLLIDPKKPQFENYAGAYLLTPNRKEFEGVAGSWRTQQELVDKAGKIINECELQGLLITQGGNGMTLVMKGEDAQHFPAHAQEVYDVTGAGDTVIATLATGIASGLSVADAVQLSCQAAGIVVGRVGTSTVSVEDLKQLSEETSTAEASMVSKLITREQLDPIVSELRNQGKKIVFTNGCFDLLHAGHVRYLEQASKLGDVVIVAVNSDDSVRQLKGLERPVNSVSDRMQMLAALSSVDMVIEFNESTPEALICKILPDVLVKGGDYQVEQIAGRQCAKEVVLIDFVEGKSSSVLIKKIQGLEH